MVFPHLLTVTDLANRRLEAADLPWASALLMQALAGHPALHYVCPDPASPAAAWLLAQLLVLTLRHGRVYANAAGTALVLWLGPDQGAFRRDMLLARVPAIWHLGWAGSQRLCQLLRTNSWLRGQQLAGPHHLLLGVAVHPGARQAGEGRRLLQATLALRQGLPCYFSTQLPEQLTFYRGLGFGLTGHCAVGEGPGGVLGTWGLLRPAAPT